MGTSLNTPKISAFDYTPTHSTPTHTHTHTHTHPLTTRGI